MAHRDITEAIEAAWQLPTALGQTPMLVGALAMAAHGYVRETSDIDVGIAVADDGPTRSIDIESAAIEMGLQVRARHSFGGFDFRTPADQRIDVVSLKGELAPLVAGAINEAVVSGRSMSLPGAVEDRIFAVASVGHIIALKLVASRRKDIGDIVELIKMFMSTGSWGHEAQHVRKIVRQHLGWYASSVMLQKLVDDATTELGGLGQ
jgi:hypothetical protein